MRAALGLSLVAILLGPNAEAGCREGLAARVCLIAEREPSGSLVPSSCLPESPRYAPAFLEAYDSLPPGLQRELCTVEHLVVEDMPAGSAYGGVTRGQQGEIVSRTITIRRAILDRGLSLAQWASWKEQLVFGGDPAAFGARPGAPIVEAEGPGGWRGPVPFLVAHELGHILDYTRDLSDLTNGAALGWAATSWTAERESRFDGAFPNRTKIAFYGDGPRLGTADAAATYTQLAGTDFVSLYGAMNPRDDLAETVAFLALLRSGGRYVVRVPGGPALDAAARLGSPEFSRKRASVEALLD